MVDLAFAGVVANGDEVLISFANLARPGCRSGAGIAEEYPVMGLVRALGAERR